MVNCIWKSETEIDWGNIQELLEFRVCWWAVMRSGLYRGHGEWLVQFGTCWVWDIQDIRMFMSKQKSWIHGYGDQKRDLSWRNRFGIYQHIDHNWSHKSEFVYSKCILWEGKRACGRTLQRFLLSQCLWNDDLSEGSWFPHSGDCDSVGLSMSYFKSFLGDFF